MLTLKTLPDAERFVETQKSLGNDIRWDNYDIVFFRAAPQGVYSKHGAFRNGVWGFDNKVPVSDKGTWEVDYKNVKRRPKRTTRS